MKILVTGSAGFIGSALTIRLLERGDTVIGIDNHNDYYDPAIKEARLNRFIDNTKYQHLRIDLTDREAIEEAFSTHKPQRVVNLAAQAGVRYSIENPLAYINSNITSLVYLVQHNQQAYQCFVGLLYQDRGIYLILDQIYLYETVTFYSTNPTSLLYLHNEN